MKRGAATVDRLIHKKRTLAVDNVRTPIVFIAAQAMWVLNNYRIRSHFGQEVANIFYARTGDTELVPSVKQNDEIVKMTRLGSNIPNEINDV